MITPDDLRVEQTIYVDAVPEAVYDLVSDITHMGDISPTCTGGHWDVGAAGTAGDWFTGTNHVDDREWQTRSQVVVADRGREFSFVVGGAEGGWVRWGYLLCPRGGRHRGHRYLAGAADRSAHGRERRAARRATQTDGWESAGNSRQAADCTHGRAWVVVSCALSVTDTSLPTGDRVTLTFDGERRVD